MEVKGILEKIRHQEAVVKEAYFALEIGLGSVKSAIWLVDKGQIKIACVGEHQSWEGNNLIEAIDASLSSAIENFSTEENEEIEEPSKVIFGLPAGWIEEDKIKPEKLSDLKEISQKLDLKPVGFVVISEAIAHYLKLIEGVPPSAVLVGLSDQDLSLTLIRLGKVFNSYLIKRSESLGDDVLEGLTRYEESEAFPARILLYNGQKDLENARQELTDYSWEEHVDNEGQISFLHLPKIELLEADFDIQAVALAGGREVAQSTGYRVDIAQKKEDLPATNEKPVLLEDFGFTKGKDVLGEKPIVPSALASDVIKTVSKEDLVKPAVLSRSQPEEEKNDISEAKKEKGKKNPIFTFLSNLKDSRVGAGRVSFFKSFLSGSSIRNRLGLIIGFVVLFLLLVGSFGVWGYWNLPRAKVLLLVEPRFLGEELEIELDPEASGIDREDLILPAKKVQIEEEGKLSRETSGTKIIGEKATGEVTIYNGTGQEKLFPVGTIISSSAGIKFSLDEDLEVASQSGTAADPEPGKGTVKVRAVEIGNEANLASGTEFSVGNFSQSDYVAKNEEAFSGGTSREVQVVAEDDLVWLEDRLIEDLKNQAIEKLKGMVAFEEKLIEQSVATKVVKDSFSAEEGEEADQVSLEMQVEASGLTYREELMRQLIEEVLKEKIPDNYVFRSEESQFSFKLEEMTKSGTAVFSISLSANLTPEFDLEEIKRQLEGKYPQPGKDYLDTLPGVVGSEILIEPSLPTKIMTFPRKHERIEIETQVKK